MKKCYLSIRCFSSFCACPSAFISWLHSFWLHTLSQSRTPAGRKKSFSSYRRVHLGETSQLCGVMKTDSSGHFHLAAIVFLVRERVCVPKSRKLLWSVRRRLLLVVVVLHWVPLAVCSTGWGRKGGRANTHSKITTHEKVLFVKQG
jgi:hypothetical protein